MPPHRPPLTERQAQVLEFIRAAISEHSRPPSIAEIGRALAIRSTNGVHKILAALERKGHIRRTPNEARSIRLVDDTVDPLLSRLEPTTVPLVKPSPHQRPDMLGRRPLGHVLVDQRLFGAPLDACVLVRATDDGMAREAIRKDDLVLLHERAWHDLPPHTLVGAIVDHGVIVRTLEVTNKRIHLFAADRHYADLVFAPGDPRCFVIGRVAGVLRPY